jgi:hypothetical protein
MGGERVFELFRAPFLPLRMVLLVVGRVGCGWIIGGGIGLISGVGAVSNAPVKAVAG